MATTKRMTQTQLVRSLAEAGELTNKQARGVLDSLSSLAITVWRIHIEEAALLGTAGDPYRHYAEHHKRLMPLIW